MNIEQTDNFIASLGFEAYRVGGSVRDEIIGRTPKDADYMIRSVDLITLFGALLDALIAAGGPRSKVTDLVLRDGQHVGYRVGRPYDIEITLPRREISTGPGHGDFKIEVDPSITLTEDAQRRDFTFNALYRPVGAPASDFLYQDIGKHVDGVPVLDPTGRGLEDLQRRMINITHYDSFRDDPLRILRALRFVARGYDPAPQTQVIMALHADSITGLTSNGHMSGTVFTEMSNILMGDHGPKALRIMRDTGVLAKLFPELAPMIGFEQNSRYHNLTTDEHTFKALEAAEFSDADLRVRWALLFHDAGKPASAWYGADERMHYYAPSDEVWASTLERIDAAWDGALVSDSMFSGAKPEDHEVISERLWHSAANRMNIDKETKKDVATLIRHHMVPLVSRAQGVRVRRMRVQFGEGLAYHLLMHRVCDVIGKGDKVDSKHIQQLGTMVMHWNKAREDGIPSDVGGLAINGRDLMAMGITGPDIGRVLKTVLDEVVVRGTPAALDREWQLSRAKAAA